MSFPVFATYPRHRLQPSVYGGFILKMGVLLLNIIMLFAKINEETKAVDLNERLFLLPVTFCLATKMPVPLCGIPKKVKTVFLSIRYRKFYVLNCKNSLLHYHSK